MAQRLIDLSIAAHEVMMTFPKVQPPKIMMLESWKEFADNIGTGAYGEEIAGGKGASLASMTARGLPMSPGFVIPSDLMEKYVDAEALRAPARAKNHVGAMWLIEETAKLVPSVLEAYATLGGKVAARSSASAENSKAVSYAGQRGQIQFREKTRQLVTR